MATTEEMDRMYRLQRYFYDATRKYYLLGRDQLLREMALQPGDRVLEIGCGTARNLIVLARQRPDVTCYGLDASHEMLATAANKVAPRAASNRASRCGPAWPRSSTMRAPSGSSSRSTRRSSPTHSR